MKKSSGQRSAISDQPFSGGACPARNKTESFRGGACPALGRGRIRGWPWLLISLSLLAAAVGTYAVARADDGTADDELASRRERLENMTEAEKEELRRKKERFDALDPDEKRRLHGLHDEICRHQHADRLRRVMGLYYEWRKTLTPGQRAELSSLPPEKRIERVKQLMQQQQARQIRELVNTPLTPEDVRAVFTWLHEYAQRHEAELLALLPDDAKRHLERIKDAKMRFRVLLFALQRHRSGSKAPTPDEQEFERLAERLSKEARKALESVEDNDKKFLLVQQWIRAAMVSRMMPAVSKETLQKFFAEDLTQAEREHLEGLPQDRAHAELRKKYYEHRFKRPGGHWRPPFHQRPGGGSGGPHRRPGGPHGDRRGDGPPDDRGGGTPDDRGGPRHDRAGPGPRGPGQPGEHRGPRHDAGPRPPEGPDKPRPKDGV